MAISFTPYKKLNVATQTWVVYTNLEINNTILFDAVRCVKLKYPLLSGNNRMKVYDKETLDDGDIVFIEYNKQIKGTPFKAITNREMRNCSTIIMKMFDRYHNIKISRGGSFQMTGIKEERYALSIIQKMWYLLQHITGSWTFQPSHTKFLGYMVCCMYNVVFTFKSYKVDLEKLNYIIKMQVSKEHDEIEYTSAYEPSVGYVGANIKISSNKQAISDARVVRFEEDEIHRLIYTDSTFAEYVDHLPRKTKSKKVGSNYQHSFMVFSTGQVIMSGKISEVNREDSYNKFCTMINDYGANFLQIK